MPRLDAWRPRIEAVASHALGAPVEIGRIEARSSGWVPTFELHGVRLRDAQGRPALELPRVSAALSAPALLGLHLRFEQLLIDGARLEMRRDRAGRVHVAGMDLEGDLGADGTDVADWFFEQHEFVIRGGALRWVDEMRAAPPLELADVQLVVRNRLRSHDLRLDATPPPAWGQRFTVNVRARQPLLERAGDWQRWRGTLHADLPQAAVGELQRYVRLPVELPQGTGALRAWVDFDRGLPRAATVDVALRDVAVRLAPELAPLALVEAGGRFVAERTADAVRVTATGLHARTTEGLSWPEGRLALTWQQRQPLRIADLAEVAPVTGGTLEIDRLDLATTAALAERLPLGTGVRELLAELGAQGQVSGLQASWHGPLDAPQRYAVRARVQGMAIAAKAAPQRGAIGRPGWRGADFEFDATEAGGRARLALNDGALEFPGVFEDPVVPLKHFAAQLQWRIEPAGAGESGARLSLAVDDARFENADAQGELRARWHTGPGAGAGLGRGARFPGVLELGGRLAQGQGTAVARYLPLGIPQGTRDYVRHAVQAGRVSGVDFRVQGDLWDFPYMHRRDGEFRIAGQVHGVTLAYVPTLPAPPSPSPAAPAPPAASPWPAFTDVAGELVFERSSMRIRQARGRLWGVQLAAVNGGIADLAEQPVLELQGQASGAAADLLRYVKQTPVGGWIGDALAQARAEGPAELRLALRLPLDHLERATVKGSVQLHGGDAQISPDTPLLGAAQGRVEFTERGVQVSGATARLYGGSAAIDGGSQPDGTLRFSAAGQASAQALRTAPELAAFAPWFAHLRGQAAYRAQLGIVRGHSELSITSALAGLAIELPAPLNKSAEANWPFQWHSRLTPAARAGAGPLQQTLELEIGAALKARYLVDLDGPTPRVRAGAVAVGDATAAPPLPPLTPEVSASVQLPHLNLDAWWPLLQAPGGSAGGDADSGYLPRAIRVDAGEAMLWSRRLTHLQLDLARYAEGAAPRRTEGWRARVVSDHARGQIDYAEPRRPASAGHVHARFERLSLPKSEAEGVDRLLEQAPTSVPALDIRVDDFELRGKKLGRLEVEAVNRSASGAESAREWRLARLSLDTPDGRLAATGQWGSVAGAPQQRRMAMDFRLDIADAGALLGRLGFQDVMRGGKGHLQGQVGWAGSPLALDSPTLDGHMALALDAGQILKAEPGVARLLGVLSLQALPRRLLLDFRDVFQEGFAFDKVDGDVLLERGVATTRNLRLRGVQATVHLEGSADIARETQDLRVRVVPELSAGAASLAYAAVNPLIGLGTLVTQWLLAGPLSEAGTREFHVSGSWGEPKVLQIERPGAAVSAAAGVAPAVPPAAASAVPAAPPAPATEAATAPRRP